AFDRQALAHGQGAAGATHEVLMQAGFPPPAALNQGRWQLTPALSRGAEVVAGERFLVMGDAAGYVEPFTGEGMAWALTAGAAAAPFVQEGLRRWSHDLEKRWKRELNLRIGRRQQICRTLAMVLKQPKPTSALFELSKRWPALSERVIASLNHVSLPPSGSQQCL
ncbi:MAG TPA: NAD-binding protein, partial [Prochlorococcus sp.]|nr:NAD-binding protein [Prochlorococcus sp.]